MVRLSKIFIIILALFLLAACDSSSSGSGGADADVALQEDPTGSVTLECLKIAYEVDGDDVHIKLQINNHPVGSFTLTADNPQRAFNHHYGGCTAKGTLALYAKSIWGTGRLDAKGVTTVKAGHTVTHTGTIVTW